MNYAFRMDDDFNPAWIHIEFPSRFDHFQSLIHHRCRVNGNFWSHLPIRMHQRLLDTHLGQPAERGLPEWSTGGGENNLIDFGALVAL